MAGSEGEPRAARVDFDAGEVGCSQPEIAELLGIPANTVKVSLYRAKRKGRGTSEAR
ncbi:MAG: sigma factor-like helix-turn-helix DNA-binding protein [Candidatus Acidiferrales bacterium]